MQKKILIVLFLMMVLNYTIKKVHIICFNRNQLIKWNDFAIGSFEESLSSLKRAILFNKWNGMKNLKIRF